MWRFMILAVIGIPAVVIAADPPKTATNSTAVVAPRSDKLTSDAWRGISTAPLTSPELDGLIAKELAKDNMSAAPKVGDAEFVRRVYLDLTGQLPMPADVRDFAQDTDTNKRAKLVDKLLDSPEYAKHWMRYWRDVVVTKYTDRRILAMVPSFELWLEREIGVNTPWNKMAWDMITADGSIAVAEPAADSGKNFFLLSFNGTDQTEERAAETSRIFLGVQIQCAQCHNHPFDDWKQEQFHELAAYFSKVRYQVKGLGMPPNIVANLRSIPLGEHKMPDKDDPKRGTTMKPKFLDGSVPSGRNPSDSDRRESLGKSITGPDNFWFAAAFVNRMWGEMMGQAFCSPIDDLGPGRPTVMPDVLIRLAASFKGSDYDVKGLLRLICNSDTYQRTLRPGESADAHLHFAAASPTRLKAESLWDSLTAVLGTLSSGGGRRAIYAPAVGGGRLNGNLEAAFIQEFRFDPSTKPDEVEGSMPQALMLMNNAQIQEKVRANGTNLLARVLSNFPQDADVIRALYLRVFARKPTDVEFDRAIKYIRGSAKRNEAFEDLLWVLLNSAEFQTRR